MAWTIEYSPKVVRSFKKDLDHEIVRRMVAKLEEVADLDNPTDAAKPLTGNLKGLWSYRVAGGYRIIVEVRSDRLVIVALHAGPRRSVYDI